MRSERDDLAGPSVCGCPASGSRGTKAADGSGKIDAKVALCLSALNIKPTGPSGELSPDMSRRRNDPTLTT
eukprot:1742302-Pyramimonas_sp.AAC.1